MTGVALVSSARDQADRRPSLYGDRRSWGLIHGDAEGVLDLLPTASIDAIVSDPPYGLNFRGEAWDGGALAEGAGFQAFSRAWAEQALRVLKPGGHMVCFSATRTQHRAIAGIEDAGFEIRDLLLWMRSGVPKSRRMKGLGSSLRPMYEPIVLARKPLDPTAKTIASNIEQHGTGALNIDAARITRPDIDAGPGLEGYWPANIALGHELGCRERAGQCGPDCAVALIDRIASPRRTPGSPPFSRLFYAATVSRAEREAGLGLLPKHRAPIFSGSGGAPRANAHPTVKPIELMRWLIRLVVPAGGVVLDPFVGSGSTGCAAAMEGRQFVGIERERAYVDIARGRIEHWVTQAEKAATP